MHIALKPLLLAAALGLTTASYAAAQPAPHHPATEPAAPAAGMMPGMTGERMDMAAMHCTGASNESLAAIRTEIGITDRQAGAWNRFVAANRAEPMRGMPGMNMGARMSQPMQSGSMPMTAMSLPQRLAHREMMMEAHLRDLQRVKAAVTRLYAVLTPTQRAKADHLLCSGMMV